MQPVPLSPGDVLIRQPWALHRGTPNQTTIPRAMLTIRYVRRWYSDNSRDANAILLAVGQALTPQQRELLRFSIGDLCQSVRTGNLFALHWTNGCLGCFL